MAKQKRKARATRRATRRSVPAARSFTTFLELPRELQFKIWEAALPVPDASLPYGPILRVEAKLPGHNLHWDVTRPLGRYKVDKRNWGDFTTFPGFSEVGMLGACPDSRRIWLAKFKHQAPVKDGVVRYCDNTTIHVDDIFHMFSYDRMYFNSWRFEEGFRRLALPEECFKVSVFGLNRRNPLSIMLTKLKNIEFVAEVVNVVWDRTEWTNTATEGRWEIWTLMQDLFEHQSLVDRTYVIPQIDVWQRHLFEDRLVDLDSFDPDGVREE